MISHSLFRSHRSPVSPIETSRALILIRLLTGVVFLLEGIKKFLMVADWGVGRFTTIGIWHPEIAAPFVGGVEIVCGALLLLGLLTRLATIPLLIDIVVAIITTKLPILLAKGFWPMEAAARADYAMLMGLLFLLVAGAGAWSVDARLSTRDTRLLRRSVPGNRPTESSRSSSGNITSTRSENR